MKKKYKYSRVLPMPMPIILEKKCENENKQISCVENDLFIKYTMIVKNFETLDDEMLNNIHSMCDENKMGIINAFNEVLQAITVLIK
jgi:hydrogenase maturation factor